MQTYLNVRKLIREGAVFKEADFPSWRGKGQELACSFQKDDVCMLPKYGSMQKNFTEPVTANVRTKIP